MKKIIGIALLLTCMLLTGCSNGIQQKKAEPFIIRNKIQFGMSPEELIELEKENGIELTRTKKSNLTWPNVDRLQCNTISIAGQDGSSLTYILNDNKLTSVLYTYSDRMELLGYSSIGENAVLETLKQKYGKPTATGEKFVDVGLGFDALDLMYHLTQSDEYFGTRRVTNTFYQWLCPTTDGTVDIMLITISAPNSLSSEYRIISYTLRTDTEMMLKEMDTERKLNQLQNDL